MKRSVFIGALALLALSNQLSADNAKFVRSSRILMDARPPLSLDGTVHEIVFYSRVEPWEENSPELEIWDQEAIEKELTKAENTKFKIFDDRNFITETNDTGLVTSIRSFEALMKHSEIAILYAWHRPDDYRPEDFPPRRLTAIVAVHRLGPSWDCELLLETKHQVQVERPKYKQLPDEAYFPWHWRLGHTTPSAHQKYLAGSDFKRYFGDVVQINSLAVDKTQGQHWLPFLYGLAYWHGILTTGRIVPRGAVLKTPHGKIEGPAVFVPSHFVGEAYTRAHVRTYSRYRFTPTLVDGWLELPDRFQTDRHWTLLQGEAHEFLMELPLDLAQLVGLRELSRPILAAPLSLQHLNGNIAGPPRLFFLDGWAESFISSRCNWEIAISSGHTAKDIEPAGKLKATFRRPKP